MPGSAFYLGIIQYIIQGPRMKNFAHGYVDLIILMLGSCSHFSHVFFMFGLFNALMSTLTVGGKISRCVERDLYDIKHSKGR